MFNNSSQWFLSKCHLSEYEKIVIAWGMTPAEIPYTSVEIQGKNPRNFEILAFGSLILPLNLASGHRNIYLLVPINIYFYHSQLSLGQFRIMSITIKETL